MLGLLGPIAFALLTGRLVALDSQPVAGVRVIVQWRSESLLATADTLASIRADGSVLWFETVVPTRLATRSHS
jgi:hypothetical protein